MQTFNPNHDIIFIRHGKSLKNEAVQNFHKERNLPEDWKILGQMQEFNQQVIFNPDLIDCHLAPLGIQQCQQARQKLKNFQPDLILCSPLQRALQTTRLVLPGRTCPYIVQPLLSQTFKHSSEVCRSIEIKKKEHPEFDFSRVQAEGEFWFIKNDSFENQKKYFDFLEKIHFQGIKYREKVEKITEFMNSTKLREDASNVRERARKVKELLKQYKLKYKTIAVVSHFFTIKFLSTTSFTEDDEPVDKIHMKNCGLYTTSLQQIGKYK